MSKTDMVNSPDHYTWLNGIEVIDVVEPLADQSGWNVACAVKYLLRCDRKGKALEDLRKAQWYINREIKRRESRSSK
jgi:hypothetical protein